MVCERCGDRIGRDEGTRLVSGAIVHVRCTTAEEKLEQMIGGRLRQRSLDEPERPTWKCPSCGETRIHLRTANGECRTCRARDVTGVV